MSEKIRLAILGSTGSIGRQTLDLVRMFPDVFSVEALTANDNVDPVSYKHLTLPTIYSL